MNSQLVVPIVQEVLFFKYSGNAHSNAYSVLKEGKIPTYFISYHNSEMYVYDVELCNLWRESFW